MTTEHHWAQTLVDRMKEIAHLNCVLRKKNRRLAAQTTALREAKLRIRGLLEAFQSVEKAETYPAAHYIATTVLRYSDELEMKPYRERKGA